MEFLPNFKQYVKVNDINLPVSKIVFSNLSEKRLNLIAFSILNLISRIIKVYNIGNAAAPGFFVLNNKDLIENGFKKQKGIYIANSLNAEKSVNKQLHIFKADPFMVIDFLPNWQNFNDYLNAFSSKYRVRAKKVLSNTENIHFTEFTGTQINIETLHSIAKMLNQTLRGKTLSMPKNMEELLKNYILSFGDFYRVRVYKNQDQIIGFIGFIYIENCVFAQHIGFNTSESKNADMYQRIFYDLIDFSIANKVKKLNLGRTATEIKSTLGAKAVENYYVVFVRNPFICLLTTLYKKWFYKEKTYVLRNPFKD